MKEISIRHKNAEITVVTSFLRQDDIMLIVMPWLPLLSGALFFREVGLITIAVVSAMLLYACRVHVSRSDTQNAAVAIVVLLIVGFISTSTFQQQSIMQIVQLMFVALAIKVGPLLRFSRMGMLISAASAIFLSLAGIIDLLIYGNLMFVNANVYGVSALCWVSILAKLFGGHRESLPPFRLAVILILPMFLAIISESRASLLAILGLIIWPIVTAPFSSPKIRTVFGLLMLLAPLTLIVLIGTGGLSSVQDLIPVVGEKSPFSGRDIIWLNIILELERNGYWGFGLGSLPGGLLEGPYEGLSAHNGFLQIFYQFGAVGLLVFFSACALLIVSLTRREDGRISVAILLAALVHEMFEVVMIQNHFGPGLLLWLAVVLIRPKNKKIRLNQVRN